MNLKSVLIKVKDFFSRVKAFLKKAVALVKEFGFGVFNLFVLFALYSGAFDNPEFSDILLAIGGLWILFIGGRFLYLLYSQKLFKEDETD